MDIDVVYDKMYFTYTSLYFCKSVKQRKYHLLTVNLIITLFTFPSTVEATKLRVQMLA